MQLIGRAWREDVLLRVAATAERLIERRPPRVRYPLLGGAVAAAPHRAVVPSTAGAASAT
jgi:hypothetical protein